MNPITHKYVINEKLIRLHYLEELFNTDYNPMPTIGGTVQKNILLETKLFKYYQNNKDNEILNKLFGPFVRTDGHSIGALLCNAYQSFLDANQMDIINDLIWYDNDIDSIDDRVICVMAIKNNRYDLIEILLDRGFKINSLLVEVNSFNRQMQIDALGVAAMLNNLKMCTFLINHGANPIQNGAISLIEASQSKYSMDIFKYFMDIFSTEHNEETELLQIILGKCFAVCAETKQFNNMKTILNYGININNLNYQTIGRILVCSNRELLELLLDHGFNLEQAHIKIACDISNVELLDLLLERGFVPDNENLETIFSKMNFDMINILIKYNIDLSALHHRSQRDNLMADLEKLGMNNDILLSYCFDDIENNKKNNWFMTAL